MQHDSFGNVIPLALASHDTNGIVNGTNAILTLRQLKWGVILLFGSCDAFGISITWCPWHHQGHYCISQVKIIKMRCNMTFCHVTPLVPALASHNTNGVINGTTAFLRSWQANWNVTWLFGLCDVTGIDIKWQQRHCHWHMAMIPALVLAPAPKVKY